MNLSQYRLKVREVVSKQLKLMRVFLNRDPLIKGGIYQTKTKCGNKNCKCAREGKLHNVWRYYHSYNGKNRIKTLKAEDAKRYSRFTAKYIAFRRARTKLIKLHRKQVELIDLIGKARVIKKGNKLR